MSPYWAAVAVILVPLGAVLKYLVWDFLHKVQSLDAQYSTRIAEAHAAIHDRKFLPIIAGIYDSIEARKAILPMGPARTTEILTELPIEASIRQAIDVISEKIALDRSYGLACRISIWVAIPWLSVVVLFSVLFFSYYNEQVGIKSLWVPSLFVPTTVFLGAGCFTLAFYRWALNKFIRTLGANPL